MRKNKTALREFLTGKRYIPLINPCSLYSFLKEMKRTEWERWKCDDDLYQNIKNQSMHLFYAMEYMKIIWERDECKKCAFIYLDSQLHYDLIFFIFSYL